jgi:uncharacterized protein YbjT (DUF2867 family)
MRVLVAGATGELGRHVVRGLQERGHWVRVLSRSPERAARAGPDDIVVADATKAEQLVDACKGIDRVFSCLGQSVGADMNNRGPGYHAIDYVANHNLLIAARQAGVHRMVYVSVFGAENHPNIAYFRAHADVAAELRTSGLSYAIIEPTGFFSAYKGFFDLAKSGRAFIFDDGSARTNPIHDQDLAQVCIEATLSDENRSYPVGGPEVHSRREVAELAFAALGKPAQIASAPAWAPKVFAGLAKPFAPRIAELMSFLAVVSTADFIAPAAGTRTLREYYAALAQE